MTFNMLAFVTVRVYLSSEEILVKSEMLTHNDPTVNVYSSGLKQVNGASCWYCMLSCCSSEMDISGIVFFFSRIRADETHSD